MAIIPVEKIILNEITPISKEDKEQLEKELSKTEKQKEQPKREKYKTLDR